MTTRAPGRPAGRVAPGAARTGGPGTGPRPPAPGGGRGFSYAKAAAVVAVAVGLGVYLLQLGSPGPARPSSGATTTTTTAPPSSSTSSTTTTTAPSAASPTTSVKILVANASQTNGVAAYYAGTLSTDGWGTLTPVTALTAETTSELFYASGDQRYAQTVATELGIPATALHALGGNTPVQSTGGAQLVVVIGNDLAAKAKPAG